MIPPFISTDSATKIISQKKLHSCYFYGGIYNNLGSCNDQNDQLFLHVCNRYKWVIKFCKIPGLNVLTENNDSVSNNWINILKIDPKKYGRTKSELINFLSSKGVETRSIWFPNHLQKSFLNEQKYKTNKSEDLFNYSICLPSSYSLTNKDILYITNSIKSYVKKN